MISFFGGFSASAGQRHAPIHHAVQLQRRAFVEGHVCGRFVDQRQGIAVAGDLLFEATLRAALRIQRLQS